MIDAKPNTTPMATSPLQYLSLTRPDIAFAINRLAQFLHHPTTTHWTALKRLLRYLQGTQTVGLQLYRDSPSRLHAFCDADHAGDKDTYLHITVTNPPAIFYDNISTTLYTKNPVFHSRMKHMALSFHFVKQQLLHGQVCIQHVASKDQLADILTKPLHKNQYLELRTKIGLTHRTSILRGRINHISPN
ncbi:hypothetical protein RND81_09G145800 [Saponaria officinalis]|uniref:Uncharacterized protein n=1 Tax=Saponaria officinalis TaxID=3572 RepID=A0AAW1ILZ5_SAPOF